MTFRILFRKDNHRPAYNLGCANKDLWGLWAPISIIVEYSKTATNNNFGAKE